MPARALATVSAIVAPFKVVQVAFASHGPDVVEHFPTTLAIQPTSWNNHHMEISAVEAIPAIAACICQTTGGSARAAIAVVEAAIGVVGGLVTMSVSDAGNGSRALGTGR